MARDLLNQQRLNDAWKKEHTLIFSIRLQNSSGIPAALAEIMAEKCVTRNGYVIEATREKLIRDGYNPENYKPKKSEENNREEIAAMAGYKNSPPEVAEYFRNGSKEAVSVKALRPYVIRVEFEDGVVKDYDMAHSLKGVLEDLKDYEVFCSVYLDDMNCIAWDTRSGHIDTSTDTVYIYGKSVE